MKNLNTELISQEILQAFIGVVPYLIELDIYCLTPELVFIALVEFEDTIVSDLIRKACQHRNISLQTLVDDMKKQAVIGTDNAGALPVILNKKSVYLSRITIISLDEGLNIASRDDQDYMNSKHLLLAIMNNTTSVKAVLENHNISLALLLFLDAEITETPPVKIVKQRKIPEARKIPPAILGLPINHSQFKCDIFMVMPFREHLNPVYQDHITKIASDLNLDIKRGDDPFSHHDIITEIWSLINNSQLVIADCTGKNPNVFYEMGLAHAIGKPVIPITQNEEDIPFDIRQRRYIKYEYTPRGMQEFEERLKRAIQSILGV